MTKADVLVVELDDIIKHPNATSLDVATVGGYKLVVKSEQFQKGDKALFVQVDSVLPDEFKKFYELEEMVMKKVKTKKLRGIYSQGLLLPLTYFEKIGITPIVGQDYGEVLGIEKYEPPIPTNLAGIMRPWIEGMTHYDVENLQSPTYLNEFVEGEHIVAREKIHGTNISVGVVNGELIVCSRKVNLKKPENGGNTYWQLVEKIGLEEKLRAISKENGDVDVILRGEVYGKGIQYLDYGLNDKSVAFFDIEIGMNQYQDDEVFKDICSVHDIPMIPPLFTGLFNMNNLLDLADKDSMMSKKPQVMEGIVIKPVTESQMKSFSRKILKIIGRRYSEKSADKEEKSDY